MAKTQNTSSNSSTMMVWVLLVVLILAGLLLYKKVMFTDVTKYSKDDTMVPEDTIENTSDLEKANFEVDEENIDAQFDSELNLLEKDAQQIQDNY